MSNTIYQLVEKYSKVKLPIQSGHDLPKIEIDLFIPEDAAFHTWGAALGWDICTKAITGVPQTEEHKRRRAESKSREIEIEGILYKSGKEAADKLGFKPSTICVWAKKNGSRYGITIPKGHNQHTYGKTRS
jgi:hypothetical protein